MAGLLLWCLTLFSLSAHAQKVQLKNLGVNYHQKPPELILHEVEVKGVHFYELHRGDLSILLPKLLDYDASSFERAFCYKRPGKGVKSFRMIGKVELKISKKLSLYANSYQQIMKQCILEQDNKSKRGIPWNPHLDFGVTVHQDKEQGKKTKIYLRDLRGLGLQTDF